MLKKVHHSLLLLLLTLLSLVMLYPLSLRLSGMVPEPTDPLLNAWRMQWNAHAFLGGPAGIANLVDTNIFYPFPLTLVYSEHFLMPSALALPFLLVADSHLLALNLSSLATFILSGYGMYLLILAWTGHRRAAWIAAILFAFSPHRFGQLNHLELLTTQWLPLALLAFHWTLTRRGWRYPLLFGIFFNLQTLSGFHFALNLTIACLGLVLIYALSGRVRWRGGLWLAGGVVILVTVVLNGPIWGMYLHFSDVMGAVRTPGEVRIYSAALTDYLTTIPHNRLYGWTFGHWRPENHQFQPLMPVGLTGLLLAGLGLVMALFRSKFRPVSRPLILFLLLLTMAGLLLSFGLNEEALGAGLAPLLSWSPYVWLYEHVVIFRGIRVPARFGMLAVVGLAGLAGWGMASLRRLPNERLYTGLTLGLTGLILLESWSAPLIGPEFPAGEDIPPVYGWLRTETPPDTVVLELPHRGASEFLYEYYASHHWRRLANGGTGFTPPIYKDMRRWFDAFPDPRSVDVIQQLGIDLVILHPAAYEPEQWEQLMAELPRYLPAVEAIDRVGEDLVLHIAPPACPVQPERITVGVAAAAMDGLPGAVGVRYQNRGRAAFRGEVRQPGQLLLADGSAKNFTEPLITPAGESQLVAVPLSSQAAVTAVRSPGLARTISTEADAAGPEPPPEDLSWQPLGLRFAEGPRLLAYSLAPERPTACGLLQIGLQWSGLVAGDRAIAQLLDPFGRVVAEQAAPPAELDHRTLPLVGPLPAGRYGLRIRVQDAAGEERLPITEEGTAIPPDQIPPLPVVIHPTPPPVSESASGPLFGGTIRLLRADLEQEQARAGDWLRFRLVWQAEQPLDRELTVFTQLVGPAGQVWAQRDNRPKGGWYSVTLWPPGQPVADDYALQIQADAPPGDYRLIAGWYDSETLERLPTGSGDHIQIGQVRIGE